MFLHDIVVIILGKCTHQPEVPDLDQVSGGQQQISGSQVTVNEALGLQVAHALCYLHSIAAQGAQEEVALVLAQPVQQRSERRQLCHLRPRGRQEG